MSSGAPAVLFPLGLAQARPQSVLFACSHNAIRSPMAEALGRGLFGKEIYFASAGLRAGEPDPFAAAIMEEIGVDFSRRRPQTFDDLEDMSFDMIISLSPQAHHRALEYTRQLPIQAIYWPTIDPSATQGSRDTILDAYRSVRDALAGRVKEAFAWRPMGGV